MKRTTKLSSPTRQLLLVLLCGLCLVAAVLCAGQLASHAISAPQPLNLPLGEPPAQSVTLAP